MKRHTQHLIIVLLIALALIVAAVATGVSRSEDLSRDSGAQLYKRFCASCHGMDGQGRGPVAPSLRVMVPDLTEISRRAGGEFPTERVRRIVDGRTVTAPHGPRDMPVWGYEFRTADPSNADAAIDRVLAHLKTMQRVPPSSPSATPEPRPPG